MGGGGAHLRVDPACDSGRLGPGFHADVDPSVSMLVSVPSRRNPASERPWVWLAVAGALMLPRLILAIWWPAGGGDTPVYAAVAENILLNGCVSLSNPVVGDCVPHWGGNQLPGYPAFLALAWSVSRSTLVALVAQGGIVVAATTWCGLCAAKLVGVRGGVVLALVVGLSPLTLPWSRYLLTDALAVASALCVLAEVFRFLADGRVRVVPLAAAFAAAVFLRYDALSLLLPVAIVMWRQRGMIAIAMCLAFLPVGAWWARSVEAGLGWLPPIGAMPDGGRAPSGYIAWGNGWMTDQYEYEGWFFPVSGRRYSEINLPAKAFGKDLVRVTMLVQRMAEYDGAELPEELDQQFKAIAQSQWRLVPARVWNMWFAPYYSSGWPVSLRPPVGASVLELARAHPLAAVVKGGTALYRLGLIALAVALAFVTTGWHRRVLLAVLAYATLHTVSHAAFGFIDTRYLLGPAAILEAACVLALLGLRRAVPPRR